MGAEAVRPGGQGRLESSTLNHFKDANHVVKMML